MQQLSWLLPFFFISGSQCHYGPVELRNFAADLYRDIAVRHESFVVNPLYVKDLLSVAILGTDGTTAEELAAITYIGTPVDDNKRKEIVLDLQQPRKDSFTVASRVYLASSTNTFLDNFKLNILGSEVTLDRINLTYSPAPSEALSEVNGWIADKTNGKITVLMRLMDVKQDDGLQFLNGVSFDEEFYSLFELLPEKQPFEKKNGGSVSVNMIHSTGNFQVRRKDYLNTVFIKLPYVDEITSLVIALPDNATELSRVETYLYEALDINFDLDDFVYTEVVLPKFKLDNRLNIVPTLQRLGAEKPFTPTSEYGQMLSDSDNKRIDNVLQRAVIHVYETSTSAVRNSPPEKAATDQTSQEIPRIVINRPFIFFVNTTEGPVIVGRYA